MIDLEELERLAEVASHGEWGNPGVVREFQNAAAPDAILDLIAEVRRLRAALSTPIAMKMKWSPMSENMVDGFSQTLGEDVLNREPARAKAVTVYYGKKRTYTSMAEFCAAHPTSRCCPTCGVKDIPVGSYCKGIDCPLNPSKKVKA